MQLCFKTQREKLGFDVDTNRWEMGGGVAAKKTRW